MDHLEIKHSLERKGYTWARIARELGLAGGPSVNRVVMRHYFSARVEHRISEILGIPLYRLFPDRYPPPEAAKRRGLPRNPDAGSPRT